MPSERESQLLAIAALLGVEGYAEPEEMAAAADLSLADFKRLFPDRDALLDEMFTVVTGLVTATVTAAAAVEGDPCEKVHHFTAALLPVTAAAGYVFDFPSEWTSDMQIAWNAATDLMDATFARGQELGLFRADLPVWWLSRNIWNDLEDRVSSVGNGETLEEAAAEVAEGLIRFVRVVP